jgi:hypothetical protein
MDVPTEYVDIFQNLLPIRNTAPVAPNDSVDLDQPTRGILVGVAGDVCVDMIGVGINIVLPALIAGVVHPFAVSRIYATSTTAETIVACW